MSRSRRFRRYFYRRDAMSDGHDEREGEREGDETLEHLLKARDGDPAALEQAFDRHRDELRRSAIFMVVSPHDH
jgi:hypothetical protein